jgi:hypothetical protein
MGFYLLDHPNRIAQYRHPRRARLSGMVGVHTSEGVMDTVGPDTGAENVARFIVGRADYGSYHVICDSDSTVNMAPDDYETWHIGADAHNWHSWGISAACRTVDWDPGSAWTQATITRMGVAVAGFWARNGFDVDKLAGRWLTREQARAHQAGLIEHGTAQPADRSDSWATRPDRAVLRQMLTDAILTAHRGDTGAIPAPIPPPSEEDDDMLKAPRKSWRTEAGEWFALRPDGEFAYINGGETLKALQTPAEGQPAEILAPIEIKDRGVANTLAQFYNGQRLDPEPG